MNPSVTVLNLPSLRLLCTVDTATSKCTGVGLDAAKGLIVSGNDVLTRIEAPELLEVYGSVKLTSSPLLSSVKFSSLHTIKNNLNFEVPALTTRLSEIFANNLTATVGTFYPSGQSTAADVCALLRTPAFTSYIPCVNPGGPNACSAQGFTGQNITVKGVCQLPQSTAGAFTPSAKNALLYVDLKKIGGTLTVNAVTQLIMPLVTQIHGALAISGTIVQVKPPKLGAFLVICVFVCF